MSTRTPTQPGRLIVPAQMQPRRGPLFVDVCGIAMYLPDKAKVVVIDARKPRVSVTDGSLIAPHMPLVGVKSGTYEKPVFTPKPSNDATAAAAAPATPVSLDSLGHVSFDYDIDGIDQPVRFDAFMLDGHTVRINGVQNNQPIVGGKAFGSMKLLAPDLELCTAVAAGTSRQVIGTIDFSNAYAIEGKAHGKHPGPLKFGHNIVDCADMAIATFEVGDSDEPSIELKNDKGTTTIKLKGDGPWRVMVGNFPVDELVGNAVTEVKHDVPLTHLELYYDLYHVGRFDPLPVPVGDNHVHVNPRTANGRCGPTLTP